MSISDYFENQILNTMLVGSLFVALHTDDPGEVVGANEVVGGSYARRAITLGAASGGQRKNTSLITWTGMPACTITHASIWDAASGGHMLWYGAIGTPEICPAGSTVSLAPNAVIVALD